MVENLVVLVNEEEILPEHLPEYCFQSTHSEEHVFVKGILPLKSAKKMLEKQLLMNAQEKYQTTREIAQALGVNQSTVVRKLNAFNKD
jgi:transcriptional regulator with PAS, ATPase and Fis domain